MSKFFVAESFCSVKYAEVNFAPISTMNALSASALEPHVDTQFGDIFQFGEFDSAKMT